MTSLFSHEETAQATPKRTGPACEEPYFSQSDVDEATPSLPGFDPAPRFIEPW